MVTSPVSHVAPDHHPAHHDHGSGTCLNCGTPVERRFCPDCGQRTDTHPVNWHFIWHEIPHSVWHVDRGIAFTLKELITRPGHTIREFLEGKRVNHYRPLALLIMLGAVLVVISKVLGVNLTRMGMEAGQTMYGQQNPSSPAQANTALKHFTDGLGTFIEEKQAYLVILMIPFMAFGNWLLFRRRGYNYPQFIVAQTFITNFNSISSIFVLVLFLVLGVSAETFQTVLSLSILLTIVYNVITYYQFFKGKISLLSVTIRSIVGFTVGYVSFMVVAGTIAALIGFTVAMYENKTAPKTNITQPVQQPHP